jgi:hypothetical protein
MRLEVLAGLPKGSRLFLLAPDHLVDAFRIPKSTTARLRKDRFDRRLVGLNPHGRTELGRALFSADVRHKLELLVTIPSEVRGNDYDVAVRQLFEDEEVGRVTWRLSSLARRAAKAKARG